jgi:glycosyltransferase involved in cell wall biosynthesis
VKILYDHQIFDLQQYGGISRYFYELIRSYSDGRETQVELAFPFTTNAYLWEASFLRLNTPLTRKRFKGSGVVNRLLAERCNLPAAVAALRRGDFDLFHPTYYDPYFLDHLGGKPFVLTVHDMTHERHPDCYPVDDPTSGWKRLLAERAVHVIADSHSTRNDLLEFIGVPEEKVTVVHLGCSLEPPAAKTGLLHMPEKYLLYVGERSRYKNFSFAVQSLAPLFREHPYLRLVCAGGGPFNDKETAFFSALGMQKSFLQMALNDSELATAYSGAIALIFPSLCEGFGIPVLEAFACGCPALLSNRTSLPEVGGDAALYFDPENGEELLVQADRLISSQDLREELVQAGKERVRRFTWERTAVKTRAVYVSVLQSGGDEAC